MCGTSSAEEIWDAVCSLLADSAPCIDGFTGHFFQGCWSIVEANMIDMILGFFTGDYLHPRVTATLLMMIPKVSRPRALMDFRPISLSTFVSKVIYGILASRLSKYLPEIIDEHQFGFVQGRSIHESIELAQKMVADIDRRTEGGNIILKYDMSKAYDRVEWRFLLRALRAMGFSSDFRCLLYLSIWNIK